MADTTLVPADLDRRFYAYVIDRLVGWSTAAGVAALVWFVAGQHDWRVVTAAGGAALVAVGLVVAVLQGTGGVTPGRSALGIRVVRASTGEPPGVARCLHRGLLLGLAGLPTAGFGVATLAWTAASDLSGRRRGWHDRRCDTTVVDARRGPMVEVADEPPAPAGLINLTALQLTQSVVVPLSPEPPTPVGPAWRVTFDTGESVLLEGVLLVGRGPQARTGEEVRHLVTLRSGDLSLSKTHAQVHVDDDGALLVIDRGSTNGSVVVRRGMSRELTPGRPEALAPGDLVRLGDREMWVLVDPKAI